MTKSISSRGATVDPLPTSQDWKKDAETVMADTYASLYYHIVFSAKNRVDYIKPEIEQRVWEYLGGIARENKMAALQVGGIEDHIHTSLQRL